MREETNKMQKNEKTLYQNFFVK